MTTFPLVTHASACRRAGLAPWGTNHRGAVPGRRAMPGRGLARRTACAQCQRRPLPLRRRPGRRAGARPDQPAAADPHPRDGAQCDLRPTCSPGLQRTSTTCPNARTRRCRPAERRLRRRTGAVSHDVPRIDAQHLGHVFTSGSTGAPVPHAKLGGRWSSARAEAAAPGRRWAARAASRRRDRAAAAHVRLRVQRPGRAARRRRVHRAHPSIPPTSAAALARLPRPACWSPRPST